MPKNEGYGARQLCALAFCAFTVPAVLLLPRLGWLWGTLGSLAAAGLLAVLIVLRGKCAEGPSELAAKSRFGRVALAAALLWNDLMLGAAAGQLCAAYPSGNAYPLVGLLLLLLSAYAADRGTAVVLRACATAFLFLLILYSILFAFALPQVRWLSAQKTVDWVQLPAAMAPICVIYLADGVRTPRRSAVWLIGAVVFGFAAAFVTGGVLSPQVAAQEDFPFYVAAKSISLFGAMERLEPLVSAAVTVGGFALLALLCLVAARMRQALGAREKSAGIRNFFLGAAGMCLAPKFPGAVLAGGTAIFWGLFPIVTLFVGAEKNLEKNEKRC